MSATAVQSRLLNGRQLAESMGVSPWFVSAMKHAGYSFTHGHQTTMESALKWRAAFPQFRSKEYFAKGWEGLPKLLLIDGHPTVVSDGKSR